ncbi:hypothetical protein ACVTMO_12290 [Pseudomonas segetis]
MIDPRDPGTQQMQLEQKRGRGRPATGQALSNAERQRRYREAQKAQRNENMHKEVAEDLRAELAKALERIEATEAKVRAEFELGERARKRVMELEAQLTQRNAIKDEDLWFAEFKMKGERKWLTCDDIPLNGSEKAKKHAELMAMQEKHGTKWRVKNQATGHVYEPAKAPK